jgi:hypothetical protein
MFGVIIFSNVYQGTVVNSDGGVMTEIKTIADAANDASA